MRRITLAWFAPVFRERFTEGGRCLLWDNAKKLYEKQAPAGS